MSRYPTKLVLTYGSFRVDGPSTHFMFQTKKHDEFDYLVYHSGMKFSTIDRDNNKSSINCASGNNGGWWYYGCSRSQLTYFNHPIHYYNEAIPYDYAELRVRPKTCTGMRDDSDTCE